MQALLLGTAGWVPTDTRETACAYVREGERLLLLDAGTSVRRLLTSPDLVRGIGRIDICLSHFHLDHIIGLSYLPGLAAGTECVVWGPGRALYGTATADLLRRVLGPPLFALEVDEFLAVEELHIGEFQLEAFAVAVRAQEKHTAVGRVPHRRRPDVLHRYGLRSRERILRGGVQESSARSLLS